MPCKDLHPLSPTQQLPKRPPGRIHPHPVHSIELVQRPLLQAGESRAAPIRVDAATASSARHKAIFLVSRAQGLQGFQGPQLAIAGSSNWSLAWPSFSVSQAAAFRTRLSLPPSRWMICWRTR